MGYLLPKRFNSAHLETPLYLDRYLTAVAIDKRTLKSVYNTHKYEAGGWVCTNNFLQCLSCLNHKHEVSSIPLCSIFVANTYNLFSFPTLCNG